MNKKGFTLVELLAVIVILAVVMLIGSVSVAGIRDKMNKNMFEKKLDLIIGAAKSWGQDNKEMLDHTMTVDNLIASTYLATDEKVPSSQFSCSAANRIGSDCLVITNNVDNSVISKLEIRIYLKNNRVYACIVDTNYNRNILKDPTKSEYDHLNYYCS